MTGREQDNNANDSGLVLEKEPRTKKPSLYKVLMLNDDYTPMEFVVMILQRFFGHDMETAQQIMLHVHQRGVGERRDAQEPRERRHVAGCAFGHDLLLQVGARVSRKVGRGVVRKVD